eukprot:3924385-Pyramimonas_sp.AAC.1
MLLCRRTIAPVTRIPAIFVSADARGPVVARSKHCQIKCSVPATLPCSIPGGVDVPERLRAQVPCYQEGCPACFDLNIPVFLPECAPPWWLSHVDCIASGPAHLCVPVNRATPHPRRS